MKWVLGEVVDRSMNDRVANGSEIALVFVSDAWRLWPDSLSGMILGRTGSRC